jgi:hypothetical protein
MEDEKNPHKPNSVLVMKWCNFPIDISEWVFVESGKVLECSPFLSHISWFSCGHDEFLEITISLLSKGSILIEGYIKLILNLLLNYLPIMSALSLMLGTPWKRL